MCNRGPSTSAQTNMRSGMVTTLAEEFIDEPKCKATVESVTQATRRKLQKLRDKPLKEDYYAVFRRLQDTQKKPYILYAIKDLASDRSLWLTRDVKLFGCYTYSSISGSHILTCGIGTGFNKAKVSLDMYRLDQFPVINSYVTIFGAVKVVKGVCVVIPHLFHNVQENYVQEYSELLKRQLEVLQSK